MYHTDQAAAFREAIKPMFTNIGKIIDRSDLSSEQKLKMVELISDTCKELAVAYVHMTM